MRIAREYATAAGLLGKQKQIVGNNSNSERSSCQVIENSAGKYGKRGKLFCACRPLSRTTGERRVREECPLGHFDRVITSSFDPSESGNLPTHVTFRNWFCPGEGGGSLEQSTFAVVRFTPPQRSSQTAARLSVLANPIKEGR